jgi:hypothetical protein
VRRTPWAHRLEIDEMQRAQHALERIGVDDDGCGDARQVAFKVLR